MARRQPRIFIAALIFALLLSTPALAVTIEQAQAVMPRIDVYFYEDGGDLTGLTEDDVTASLDGLPLEVKELSKSEQGIFYVYMLDVSGSIPAAHFSAARDAIKSAYGRLREQDALALIAFGDEVTPLLRGGESRTKVMEALDSLAADDANTRFYDAMDALVELVAATEEMRRVAVVISDGMDDAQDGTTREELEAKLQSSGVSVSAMCVDTAPEMSVESFREVIETSGGGLYTFSAAEAGAILQSLLERLDGGWLLRLEADSNIADGRTGELSMTFGESVSAICPVAVERWTPDETPPAIRSAKYDPQRGVITVTYSEPVAGADEVNAYALMATDGAEVGISGVEWTGEAYVLTLAGTMPESGAVTLSVDGPADVSMEQNPLAPYTETVYSALSESPDETAGTKPEPLIDTSTIIMIAAAVVLVAAAVFLIIRMTKKKSAPKQKKEKKSKKPQEKTGATFVFEKKK